MKSEEGGLEKGISEGVGGRGAQKPPRRIRVGAMKCEDGQVQAERAEE